MEPRLLYKYDVCFVSREAEVNKHVQQNSTLLNHFDVAARARKFQKLQYQITRHSKNREWTEVSVALCSAPLLKTSMMSSAKNKVHHLGQMFTTSKSDGASNSLRFECWVILPHNITEFPYINCLLQGARH